MGILLFDVLVKSFSIRDPIPITFEESLLSDHFLGEHSRKLIKRVSKREI